MALIYLYDSDTKDFTYNGQPLPKAYDVVVKHFLNDEYYVTWKHAIDKEDIYKDIQKNKIITVHTPTGMQPFRIMDPVKTMDYVEFEAWPLIFADMRNKLIRPLSLINASGQQAIDAFVTNLLLDTPFEFTTNITERHDYNTQNEDERENNPNQYYDALEIFKALIKRWNAEISINGYDIRIVNRVGEEKQALLYEKKNIVSYIDRESISGIVTRLYGKSEWTESVDGGENINHSIQASVDSPLIDSYNGIIFEKQYTNNDIHSEQELKEWLNLKFTTENIDKPSRNIELDTNIIESEEVHLGDGLVLKYLKHDVDMHIRMIGYDYDGYANRYIKTYLGDAKDSFTGSVSNTVTNVESNARKQSEQIAHVILNRQGVKVIYSPVEPTGDFRNNDIWFDEEGGMFKYDSQLADWIPHPYNQRIDIAEQAIKEQHQDVQDAKDSAAAANQQINDAIMNAGFTSLNDLTSNLRSLAESADLDAEEALLRADNAYTLAEGYQQSIVDLEGNVSNQQQTIDTINQSIMDAEGNISTLEQTVNGLQNTVADKANQTTVTQLSDAWSATVAKISEWTNEYVVNINNHAELTEIDGELLTKAASYEITLGIQATGTNNKFIASLVSTGSSWNLKIHEQSGTNSNHPYVYLNSNGYPIVATYHSSNYRVFANIRKMSSRYATSLTMLEDQINLKVSEGNIVSQINIEARKTLIQSNKLILDADTVTFTGSAFIPDAAISSLSADKLTAGEIDANQISVINVDVNNLVGYVSEFVKSYWNTIDNRTKIDGTGLTTRNVNDTFYTKLISGNVEFGDDFGTTVGSIGSAIRENSSTIRGIGVFVENGKEFVLGKKWTSSDTSYTHVLRTAINSEGLDILVPTAIHSTLNMRNNELHNVNKVRLGTTQGLAASGSDYSPALIGTGRVSLATGDFDSYTAVLEARTNRIDAYQYLHMNGGGRTYSNFDVNGNDLLKVNRIHLNDGYSGLTVGTWPSFVGETGVALGYGSITSWANKLRVLSFTVRLFDPLDMNGNPINNQSDIRFKRVLGDTENDSLAAVKSMRFIDYYYTEADKPKWKQFGVSAQDTPFLSVYNEHDDRYMVDTSKQIMMNSHAIQQLAGEHENTLQVASHAYILAEQHEDELAVFKKKIEKLEDKVKRLEGAA